MNKATMSKVESLIKTYKAAWNTQLEIQSGVVGSLYNPSDSDMAEGRICFRDISHAKGHEAAVAWERAKAAQELIVSKARKMRNEEAKALFFKHR